MHLLTDTMISKYLIRINIGTYHSLSGIFRSLILKRNLVVTLTPLFPCYFTCRHSPQKAIFTKIALLNLYESTFLHCFCRKDVS